MIAGILTRWMLYLAMAAVAGGVVAGLLLRRVRAAGRHDEAACSSMSRAGRRAWLGGLLLLAVVGMVRAWLQVDAFRDSADPFWPVAGNVLGGTSWGRGAGIQLVGVLLSLLSVKRGDDASPSGALRVAGALLLVVAPAWQGHAAGVDRYPVVSILADALHTAAFSVWIGTLLVLWWALLERPGPGVAEGARGLITRDLIARFSPVALGCGALLVVTGAGGALLHLTEGPDLWRTGWGRLLVAKLLAAAGVAAAGAHNWRRVTPHLGTAHGQDLLRGGARRELALATIVLAVTAVLTGTGTPGSE